jgi:transcriptional regulator with XRE-family HTH domain
MSLLERLKLLQRQARMSDREFAQLLGCTGQFWGRVKRGKRGITVAVLGAVLRRFPELTPEVLAFLEDAATSAGRSAGRA